MKLFFHYCSFGFSNCYILGAEENDPQEKNAAIIVDPGSVENITLDIIEKNNFDLKAVLITHDHLAHVRGVRTLKKIYNTKIFAVNHAIMDHKTTIVKDGEIIKPGGFIIEVLSIPGHSSDSVVYRINNFLFTGDVLTAGLVGNTASTYGATTQMNKMRSRLLSLPGDYVVLPGHGPPSTLEAERRFNAGIINYGMEQNKRRAFHVDF